MYIDTSSPIILNHCNSYSTVLRLAQAPGLHFELSDSTSTWRFCIGIGHSVSPTGRHATGHADSLTVD